MLLTFIIPISNNMSDIIRITETILPNIVCILKPAL